MSTFRRSSLYVLVALVAASVVYFVTRGDESGTLSAISSETPAAEPLTESKTTEDERVETPGEVQNHEMGHAADCAHCAKAAQSSTEAVPQLLTNPEADYVFKTLENLESKLIPRDTFDFLKGKDEGDQVSFNLQNLDFQGKVSLVRENHAKARTYSIDLDDELGRVVVRTDANGALRAEIFFFADSRVVQARSARVEGEGELLVLKSTTISSVVCAAPDTVLTKSGFRSVSGTEILSDPFPSKPVQAASTPLSIPKFESNPESDFVMYLDFDGETVEGTVWNTFADVTTIVAEPVPMAGDATWIELVWRRVVEDYASFDINITTDEAVFNAPSQDPTKRLHVVISTSRAATGSAGGIAYLHSFREDSPICWVRNDSEYTCATTISHEAGHTFGLEHDGLDPFFEYYFGHNDTYAPGWAPIMGAAFSDGFYDEVDQWSIGDYTDSTNKEDDLARIGDDIDPQDDHIDFPELTTDASNGFGFVADEYGDEFDQSRLGTFQIIGENLIQGDGLISTTDDVDVFAFSAPEGELRFTIKSIDVDSVFSSPGANTSGANLAVKSQLLDATGQVIAEGVPTGGNLLSSLLQASVSGGTYFLSIEGAGRGDGPDTGFSDYGSLGQYTVIGELALPPLRVAGGSKQTVTIFDGAVGVDPSNGTDFGFTTPGNAKTNTFILENGGQIADITDLSISLAGGSSSQFSVGNLIFNSLRPGEGNYIDITYAPSTTGTHSETVTITYEAGGPQTFEFRVRGSATDQDSADNYENNDSGYDAYDLNDHEGVWLEDIEGLAFFLSDQNDWYSFNASPEDDVIRIDTSPEQDAQNIRFNLVHFNGSRYVVVGSTSGGLIQYIIPEEYSGDRRQFFIHVTSSDNTSVRNAYDLRWSSVELLENGDDFYEENDTRATAFDLTGVGNQLSEILGPGRSSDEDWYRVDVDYNPFTRMLYVAALFDHAEGNIDIEVYRGSALQGFSETDSDQERVFVYDQLDFNDFPEPFAFTPDGNFLIMGAEPGTYYIRVYGDFAGNEYDLIVEERTDDGYEIIDETGTENDTQATAYPLGEEIVGQWLTEIDGPGTIADYPETATEENFINRNDRDWYSFNIEGTNPIGELTVEFRSFDGGTVEFYLYNSAGELLVSSSDDSPSSGVLSAASPTGRNFFVQVRAEDPADVLSGYDFQVNFSEEPPFNEEPVEDNYEENDTFLELFDISDNEGRYLSSVDGYGTHLDPDWFEIAVPNNASKLEVSLVFVNADGDLDLTLSKKEGPVHFTSSNGTDNESIVWEDPIPGAYALTVTGDRQGNFYNLLWDITFSEDNYEENDTLAEAFDLTGFENRLLNKLDGVAIQADDDWYKISAGADTVELRAAITFTNAQGDIDLALYNAGGALISRSITTSDNEELVYNNPPQGDYYLRVYFGNESNEYDLSWAALSQAELDLIPEGDDSYEENDSIAEPYVLSGTSARLSEDLGLALQKDDDWYQFEVPENNVGLRLEATFTDSLGDIDLEMYDPLGFPLAVRDSITDNELLEFTTPVPPGVYTVRIYGPNLGNEYDLYFNPYLEDIYEENDFAAEAYDITSLLGSPLSNEGVPTLGDEDWFTFTVAGDLPFIAVELNYKNQDGAINFELLDSSETVVATADSLDDFDSVLYEATNGTYFVRVYGDNAYNSYDLEVNVIGDDEYEDNDTSGQAFDISELPSFQAVQFDEDWYQFEVTAANNFLTVNAGFNHQNGNIDLFLYNASDLNNPIGSSTSTSDNEALRVPGVAGTYYVQITGDNTNQNYQLAWTVAPDDEFEQNDELADATDIASDEGVLVSALQYDPDWFEISVGPGKLKVVIDLLFEHASGDLSLTLYDSDGEELLVEDSVTDNEQLSYSLFPFGNSAETYYIKVDGDSVGTEYQLTWQTSIEDNFEGDGGNNSYHTASEDLLDVEGLRISETIGYGGALNDDWYKVQINPGDTGIVIEVFFEHTSENNPDFGENNIDLELFGSNEIYLRRSVATSTELGPIPFVERINFEGPAGTYYLRVFGSSSEKPYDLVWNSYAEDDLEVGDSIYAGDDPPDNDTPEFPRGLQFLLSNLVRGSTTLEFVELDNLTQLDEDWYLVEVFEGEDIFLLDLEFEHNQGDIDVAVYNWDTEELIAQSESKLDEERIALNDLPAGEYLICVYGYGIYSPKSEPGWTPGSFDPYTEDWDFLVENPDATGTSYYELDEAPARSLGNTYSMRWISTTDDEYDVETVDTGDIEINDSFGTAAVPDLVDDFGVLDADGILEDNIRTRTETNLQGDPVTIEYKPVYTYNGLSQLDDDWYRFTVDTGGVHDFYAAISFSDFQANLDLRLYDDSNTLLASSTGNSSVEFIELQGTGEQTYYLKVTGENLGTPYSLLVRGFFDDIYEENDDLSQADENANITLLTSELFGEQSLITGLVQRDVDLFRVDIDEHQVHLEFDIDAFGFFPSIEVLDSEGIPLEDGYTISGNTDGNFTYLSGVISPEAGTYYLRVTGDDDGSSYELQYRFDNQDEYEGFQFTDDFEVIYSNDLPEYAENLTRFRLEPQYNPDNLTYAPPIKEFAFDYGLLSTLYFSDGFLVDPFGHALQEADDWYSIQIPSWFLANAKKGDDTIQVIKRQYYLRLFAEIEFLHDEGDINLEIYNGNDLVTPMARAETEEDFESLTVAIDPTDEDLVYYLRVYGADQGNDYSLNWDVSVEDFYEQLEDEDVSNDNNNFVDEAYDLTQYDIDYDQKASTEGVWLHEIEYMQDVNGDGEEDINDGGIKSTAGYGMQRTDDWYAVAVSEGATQLEVDVRFYSDNDTGYEYLPDDLDIDFEVYFLAGNDNDPATRDLRKPVLVGRSIETTDETLFSSAGEDSKTVTEDITTEITEAATFDVDEPGIYLIRIYYDNRSHPYTFYWDDIGVNEDSSGDAAIINDYVNGNWSYDPSNELASAPKVAAYEDLDGDGFQNYAEFALGMDTSTPDYAVIGQSIGEFNGERYFQFEYVRNKEAAALGYEFIVQESHDLSFEGDSQAVYVEEVPVEGSSELERVIYRCSKTVDEQPKCFFRLVVNEPSASKPATSN